MKKLIFKISAATASLSLLPAVASAQANMQLGYLSGLITSTQTILNTLLPLVVTLAVLFFFWGLAMFIMNAGDEDARARGRSIMIWGVVALFVIVAVWGLVGLLAQIFGVKTGQQASVPGVSNIPNETVIIE